MSDSDNPATGPLSIDQALDRFEAAAEATPSEEVKEEPTETEAEQVEVAEAEEPVEAEAEAEEADPETEEPADAGDDEQTLTLDEYGEVRVQMGEEVVTLAEIAERVEKGTLRQADYTRKTQELAQERKALEAKEAELAEKQQQLDAAILKASGEEPEPDWEAIFAEDPFEGPLQKVRWEKAQAAKAKEREAALARQEAASREVQKQRLVDVLQHLPEWAEEGVYERGEPARRKAAMDLGFTEEEYRGTVDPRVAHAFELIARYRAQSTETATKVDAAGKKLAKAPKVMKPGSAKASADRKAEEKAAAQRKLSRPHSVDDHLKAMGIT